MKHKGRSISRAGAPDLRELARAFKRVGLSRAKYIETVELAYSPANDAELKWLRKTWAEANKDPPAP